MKKFTLILLLLVASLHVGAQMSTITVGGLQREYMIYVPQNLGENRPLLISCHGMKQDAAYQKGMLSIESVADTAKFVTVFPNGIGNADGSNRGWDISGDRDINFILALIDEMADKYKIDRKRVYLSGFSMGGMLTYHAMNRIADKIAAFAPISGYSMGGTTANANVRPIPIIHTHGTSDDVVNFSGVQGALNAWINHNGCPTRAKVTQNYRGAAHITRHVWGPGNNGVEVVLMEMANKGHWISNDNGVLTGDEIWRFCSRYSLDLKDPSVRITSPKSDLNYISFGGPSEISSIPVKATASDPDGQVVGIDLYDGNTLLEKFEGASCSYTLTGLTAGEHEIRAVVTDDEGRKSSSTVTISVVEPTGYYQLHKNFVSEGSVPEGWTTYDGNEKRVGYSAGYSSGSRVFHFTGEKHDFEWGLYTRNVNGNAKAGYARFADKDALYTLTLYPGRYELVCRMANWNRENLSPVTVAVETTDYKPVFSETFTPTSNVGNSAANSFSGSTNKTIAFEVKEKGRYVLTFYTADAAWADLVVGLAVIRRVGDLLSVDGISDASPARTLYYNMAGRRIQQPQGGVYVEKTVKADGTVSSRKVMK